MRTSVVFFTSLIEVLTSPGTLTFSACGNRIWRRACHLVRPSVRGLGLPDGNRQQAAPDDLGHIGGSEEYERELDARQAVDREIRGHEQRKQDRSEEEHPDQRRSANQLDEDDARPANAAPRRPAAEREEYGQRKRADNREAREQQCDRQAAPLLHRDIGKARESSS